MANSYILLPDLKSLIWSPAHVLHLRRATSEFFGKPETFKHDGKLMGIDMANVIPFF